MKRLIRALLPIFDIILSPILYPAALLLKAIRRAGVHEMPLCKRILLRVGVFPIRNHYYEPLFDGRILKLPLDEPRRLPGIDWNDAEQLSLLGQFHFSEEFVPTVLEGSSRRRFHFNNGFFESGDAEYFYNLIRLKKPARLFEIGCGYSTMIALSAIEKNRQEIPGYSCQHLCIDPYESVGIEKLGATMLRRRVEEIDGRVFLELEANDILFIDSSHVIRPQGDVLREYLEIIPSLKKHVIVHLHDIFSPRDYLKQWIVDEVRLWNEQYLLEGFLTCNREWKIIGALNYLRHAYYDQLKAKCPFLTPEREPVSFYIQKV